MNLQDLIAKITGFEQKMTESDNRIKSLETNLAAQTERANASETKVSDLTAKLSTFESEKANLTKEATDAKAESEKLKTENTDLKGKLEDPKGTIQTEASKQALTIVAKTGTPPIETDDSAEGSAHSESITEQYLAITDPGKRVKFFEKHHNELHQTLAGVLS